MAEIEEVRHHCCDRDGPAGPRGLRSIRPLFLRGRAPPQVTLKPWAERDRRAFSRYAQFCRSAHVALRETANASLGEYMECPRKHLAEVSLQHGAVNGATLDVFPATGDKGDPLVRPPASFLQFGKSRYIVVSDGWVRGEGWGGRHERCALRWGNGWLTWRTRPARARPSRRRAGSRTPWPWGRS